MKAGLVRGNQCQPIRPRLRRHRPPLWSELAGPVLRDQSALSTHEEHVQDALHSGAPDHTRSVRDASGGALVDQVRIHRGNQRFKPGAGGALRAVEACDDPGRQVWSAGESDQAEWRQYLCDCGPSRGGEHPVSGEIDIAC